MLQITPKWRISVTVDSTTQVFWISNSYISNVLQQVATMQFSSTGLERLTKITIEEQP